MAVNESFSAAERSAVGRLEKGIDLGTVIPVVGAGVSRQGAELPSWDGLLAEALEWTERNRDELGMSDEKMLELQKLSVDSPTGACYETWVETVFTRNSEGNHWDEPAYRDWLQEVFGAPKATDRKVYEALGAMDPRVIITTNFDKLLTSELLPDGDTVTWDSEDAIRSLLRERQGVLHLHGTYDEPQSVILTPSDYARITQADLRSKVAQLITCHAILLFVGVSAAGATDRHLAELLKLGMARRNPDAPHPPRTHVMLHRGELPAKYVSRLKKLDIEPVRFGDEYADLAPFLENLSRRRTEYRNAALMVGLDRDVIGESLSESRWAPEECLQRVDSGLSFLGLRSSKWVTEPGPRAALDEVLGVLDGRGRDSVRFLILNPDCDAYERLEGMRGISLSSDHLETLAELEQRHESLVVKCVDFISAFRFTAVNGQEMGLALYPTTPREFKETEGGWKARHHSLHAHRPWSLARSLLFMFDEHFQAAEPLRNVRPGLFS